MRYYFLIYFFVTHTIINAQVINVSTSAQLQAALNTAVAGQIITIASGNYTRTGGFVVTAGINGTNNLPITLTGVGYVSIGANSLTSGYGLNLMGNNYWIVKNITVYNSKKGIVLDNSNYITLNNVRVIKTGDEAIHLRTYSSYNTIKNCFIDSTGIITTGVGEAIYVGSAESNWCTYTNCLPDTSNYNVIDGNTFGNSVVSENIDIKEGTAHGTIKNNIFNGIGLNNINTADSWVDVKGNYYTIECNQGANALVDGFQTHINAVGYGNFNTFSNNTMQVNNVGFGINIKTNNSTDTAYSNKVCNNNTVINATAGLTNVATIACASNTCNTVGSAQVVYNNVSFYPNPINSCVVLNSSQTLVNAQLVIYNHVGQTIKTLHNISGTQFIINTDSLVTGFYYFKLTNNGNNVGVYKISCIN
jgi:hypothetical protein